MIVSLMYLTSSRLDIMFAVCAYARYQVNSKVSHLHVVKKIFRYLKGQPKFSLWYPRDSPFDLVACTDSDYAEASLGRKSTTGGSQFLRCRLISWQCKKHTVVANFITEAEYVAASSCCGQYALTVNPTVYISCIEQFWTIAKAKTINEKGHLQALVVGKKILIIESTKLTFYKAFFSSQWKFLIHDILQCLSSKTHAWNEFSSTIASAIICLATNHKFNFSNYIVERVNTPRIDEDSLKLKKLTELCTNLQNRVLDLEITKTTQAMEIESLKRMVKKLEKKQSSRTYKHKRLYKVGLITSVESSDDNEDLGDDVSKQGRISDIDADKDITLVSTHNDAEMFDTDKDLHGEEVFVAKQDENIVEKEVDAAQVQHTKPKAKAKGIVFHELEESTTTTSAIPKPKLQDKGKAKMIEEPVKLKKKDQIMLDEEVSLKLQAKLHAEFNKEQRIARDKAQKEEEEAKIVLIESWDDVQAKINADYHLVERLQAKEQQELNDKEKATLFMQLLEKRRKFFAANITEEKKNNPPTQA
nr:putative ribonuclease H-like domain-containing protein [Tanacetum cinerariifolium]